MHRNRQPASVFVVRQMEQLLKELCIEDGNQEIEAGIIVWNERKQRDLLLTEACQIQLVCSRLNFSSLAASVIWMLLRVLALPLW